MIVISRDKTTIVNMDNIVTVDLETAYGLKELRFHEQNGNGVLTEKYDTPENARRAYHSLIKAIQKGLKVFIMPSYEVETDAREV